MTSTAKTYHVKQPLGNHLLPKEVMLEGELREYAMQVLQPQDGTSEMTWQEKIQKDPIDNVVEWLKALGYTVTIK